MGGYFSVGVYLMAGLYFNERQSYWIFSFSSKISDSEKKLDKKRFAANSSTDWTSMIYNSNL